LSIGFARRQRETGRPISESPYYVKVNDYSVNELVTRGKSNFLQQPTPAPGATPTATPK